MIQSIRKHYEHQNIKLLPHDITFNHEECFTKDPTPTFIRNTFARITGTITKRNTSIRKRTTVFLPEESKAFINLINGTVVVLLPQRVDKFFFKDIEYFLILHGTLQECLNTKLQRTRDFLLVISTLYPGSPLEHARTPAKEVFKQINNISDTLNSTGSLARIPSPTDRVSQIFRLLPSNNEIVERFSQIIELIEKKLTLIKPQLCHGDLWNNNILVSEHGLAIIDFDKAFTFTPRYDNVYYRLMSQSKRKPYEYFSKITRHAPEYSRTTPDENLATAFFATIKCCENEAYRSYHKLSSPKAPLTPSNIEDFLKKNT